MYPNTVLSRKCRGSRSCGNPPAASLISRANICIRVSRAGLAGDSSEICSAERRLLVLPVRIELTTSPLPRECSTTELRQRDWAELNGIRKAPSRAILATGRPRGASSSGSAVAARGPRSAAGDSRFASRYLGSDQVRCPRKSQAPQGPGAGPRPRGGGLWPARNPPRRQQRGRKKIRFIPENRRKFPSFAAMGAAL